MRNGDRGSDNGSGGAIDGTVDSGNSIIDNGDPGTVSQSESTDSTIINAESGNDPTEGVRKRGRRTRNAAGNSETSETSGSGGRKAAAVDLKAEGRKALAMQIIGAHELLGVLTGMPGFWNIQQPQGEALVAAVMDVCAQYKIKPNPKVAAWLNLAGVCGMVYVPKIILLREMKKARPKPRPAPEINPGAPVRAQEVNQQGVMTFG